MKFVQSEKFPGKMDVEFKIDQTNWGRLESFASGLSISDEMAIASEVSIFTDVKAKLGLSQSDIKKLENMLANLVTRNNKVIVPKLDLQKQIEELIFIYSALRDFQFDFLTSDAIDSDFDWFTKLVDFLNVQSLKDKENLLKLSMSIKIGNVSHKYNLPQANNSKELFKRICDVVLKYYFETAEGFGQKWYLWKGYKQPVTLALMNEKLKSGLGGFKPDADIKIAIYISKLLSYLILLPQFPPSKGVRNIRITGPQAKFIDVYLNIFGFYQGDYVIKLTDIKEVISPKDLRRIYERSYTKA
ncbi:MULTISPECIES: hypothetical protein [unclassified Mucilaginibacter]|uniref:hypothetical protein n=1 Tax=unclassified Mucilaginibacter TaxID=2617802 RepID=UPI0033985F6F